MTNRAEATKSADQQQPDQPERARTTNGGLEFYPAGSRFFDMEAEPDPDVAITDPSGGNRPDFVVPYFGGRVQSHDLVTNPDGDGLRLSIFHVAPGTVFPRHSHNVDYIEFVLEGEVHHGNKVVRRGAGVYRKAGTPYTFTAGPEGAVIADFRAHTFYNTTWIDDPSDWPPHRDWTATDTAGH